jgi:hypothetical protein
VTERWETVEAINAARTAMEVALDWERPAAWGLLTPDGAVVRANVRGAYLPGVALAGAVGHRAGSRAYRLTAEGIEQVLAAIAPAEACTAVEHPNIAALRLLGDGAMVAFIAEEDFLGDPADVHIAALLADLRRGRQENADGTTTLWRPTGPDELEQLRLDGFRAWPPRLPEQPIFYPVLNEDYAATIAREWNVAASGTGYVTRFRVATPTARRYPTQVAGGPGHLELWVPAEDLETFNNAIVGEIEVVAEFSGVSRDWEGSDVSEPSSAE